jgi:hypothetical protein
MSGQRSMTPKCEHPEYEPGEPHGFLGWYEWVEEKTKTHRQTRCRHCKRYAIWVPHKYAASARSETGESE